jgi:ubiquinone/menaquinone biosynthesis C-methylase UbiE
MLQHIQFSYTWLLLLLLGVHPACAQKKQEKNKASQADSSYQYKGSQSGDGTGKYYLGREIAQVMGHQGAGWLERSEREKEERTDLLLKALNLKPSDVVADIGAGTGYFTFRISPLVPQGKVLAVDIQQEMIDYLNENKAKQKASNVEPVLGTITDPNLPAGSVDLVLFVDAYHEFSHPREMMQAIVTSLKPGGQVALVEYRAEDPNVPIRPRHKMTQAQATKEMNAVGLYLKNTSDVLPPQPLLFYEKKKTK